MLMLFIGMSIMGYLLLSKNAFLQFIIRYVEGDDFIDEINKEERKTKIIKSKDK